jgi:hypothetical protein
VETLPNQTREHEPEPLCEPIAAQSQRKRRAKRIILALLLIFIGGPLLGLGGIWGFITIDRQRQETCRHHLTEIGKAFHAYQNKRDTFPPPTIRSIHGEPLLSWRVAILPYLDGGESLYQEFHLNEAWDSPHNLGLVARMPEVYGCPSDPSRLKGETPYRVLYSRTPSATGNPMFEEGRGVQILEITDGTSNTILVAETRDSVPWTKPDEVLFDPKLSTSVFGSGHKRGFHILMVDGLARFLMHTLEDNIFRPLLTRDGGEIVGAS